MTEKIVMKSLADIKPYERNPRNNSRTVGLVASSITEFGFKNPIIIDKNGVIIAGHTRYAAAKKLGMTEVPCIIAEDLTEQQVRAFRLADNKVAEVSVWDTETLIAELGGITDINMTDFGFRTDISEMGETGAFNDIFGGAPEKKVREGDVFQMGEHRLICGAVNDTILRKLMNGKHAKIIFSRLPAEHFGDIGIIQMCAAFVDYLCIGFPVFRKDDEIDRYWDAFVDAAKSAGLNFLGWNVWDKGLAADVPLPICHEWIFVFGEKSFEINLTQKKKTTGVYKSGYDVLTVRNPDGSMKKHSLGEAYLPLKQMDSVFVSEPDEHGESVPLAAEYAKAMTKKKEIVLDIFGNYGTTMIACEQVHRPGKRLPGRKQKRLVNQKGGARDGENGQTCESNRPHTVRKSVRSSVYESRDLFVVRCYR